MRKVITIWLAASLLATIGLVAYLQLGPQKADQPHAFAKRSAPEMAAPRAPSASARSATDQPVASEPKAAASSQNTEQLALMISIGSSIISAVAALMQTWLTHRAVKTGR